MSVEELVQREPWRRGAGQPRNALDPTWSIAKSIPCNGEIGFETGTKWWWCEQCGYCGTSSYHAHATVKNPMMFLAENIQGYLDKRSQEGVSRESAIEQMLQVAGTALGYAASFRTDTLKDYLDQLKVR